MRKYAKGKKKIYKKQTSKKAYVPKISRNIRTGFSPIVQMKHTYVQNVNLNSVVSALTNYIWSCNGMYDPYIAGGSGAHQPYYFDQMIALYNHYTVIGSRFTVEISPRSNDESQIIALHINDDATVVPTDINTLREIGSAKCLTTAFGAVRSRFLSTGWSMKKAFRTQGTLANSQTRGSAVTNPSEAQYFVLSVQSTDAAVTTACHVTVKIEYIAIWNELKDIAGS